MTIVLLSEQPRADLARRNPGSYAADGLRGTCVAISRLATPSSPVTAGARAGADHAPRKGKQLGTQGLGMADREVPHGLTTVRLESKAYRTLTREQIAHHVFSTSRNGDVARLEWRQPVGIDVRKHA